MAPTSSVLSRSLKAFSLFAIATGSLDVYFGTGMVSGSADLLPTVSPVTAILDSQMRFLGATWAGYGAMLWWTSNDLQTRRAPLGLLGGIVVFAGIGRALSALEHGFGAFWVKVAMGVELVVPAAIYLLGF